MISQHPADLPILTRNEIWARVSFGIFIGMSLAAAVFRTSQPKGLGTIPPPPDRSKAHTWNQWFLKTYAPGTRVRAIQNLSDGVKRGEVGTVIRIWPEDGVQVSFPRSDEMLLTATRRDIIVYIETTYATADIQPIDDNWGDLVGKPLKKLPPSQRATSMKGRRLRG